MLQALVAHPIACHALGHEHQELVLRHGQPEGDVGGAGLVAGAAGAVVGAAGVDAGGGDVLSEGRGDVSVGFANGGGLGNEG